MYGFSHIYHEDLMQTLIDSVHSGTHQHAYIFEGPEGIGKRESARLFAAALTCLHPQSAPCGTCASCIQSKSDTNPDIIYVNTGDKKSIGTDRIREIASDSYVRPFSSARKVYLIEEGDCLTEQAQNAFLKVLEEPPEYVVFVILTSNASVLLETIRSRCVLIRFAALSEKQIRAYLKEQYPEQTDKIDFLAAYSGGIPGEADRIAQSDVFYSLRASALSELDFLLSARTLSAYHVAEFFEANKDDSSTILSLWQSFFRDMLLLSCSSARAVINTDYVDVLKKKLLAVSERSCIAILDVLLTAAQMHRRYVNNRALSLYVALNVKEILKKDSR